MYPSPCKSEINIIKKIQLCYFYMVRFWILNIGFVDFGVHLELLDFILLDTLEYWLPWTILNIFVFLDFGVHLDLLDLVLLDTLK